MLILWPLSHIKMFWYNKEMITHCKSATNKVDTLIEHVEN